MLGTALVLAAVLTAPAPHPPTCVITVNSTADVPEATPGDSICETAAGNGVCTLRAAVMTALGMEFVTCTVVLPAGTYTLTRPPDAQFDNAATGDFDLWSPLKVEGAGPGRTTIAGADLDRIFEVHEGASLELSNLALFGGMTSGNGGLINASGAVTLRNTRLVAGQAGAGGCIFTTTSLTVLDSQIESCYAVLGGGVYAVLDPQERLLVERSAVSDNLAQHGGGVIAAGGRIDVINSTFSGNRAFAEGGALLAAPLFVYSSTIFDNQADYDADGTGTGGGIWTPSESPALLSNSILAGNHAGAALDDCAGSIVSAGFNLVQTPWPGCNVLGTYLHGTFDWGVCLTGYYYHPSATSAVLGAGDPNGCVDPLGAPLLVDQRGAVRPIVGCDLGAIERGPAGDVNGDGARSVADVFYLINALFAGGPPPKGWPDVDGKGPLGDVVDVFYLINFLFAGGAAPIEPP